ncbi:MAG: hypothetical protein DI617_09355 [Streptococcus pyogenes]|nr:MAG: hypothetical protein DI617_09355 [Streptococcus pyogenes]
MITNGPLCRTLLQLCDLDPNSKRFWKFPLDGAGGYLDIGWGSRLADGLPVMPAVDSVEGERRGVWWVAYLPLHRRSK